MKNKRDTPVPQHSGDVRGSATAPLVFSTEHGKMCPGCGKPVKACCCRLRAGETVGDGKVRISRETKGRKGAGVTVISGLPLEAAALEGLARDLKKSCGCGGSIKNGRIEIQGDHRQKLQEELFRRGWKVKQTGG
jgi:translation initiation factor 1